MKKLSYIILTALTICMLVMWVSCEKDDDTKVDTNPDTTTLTTGTWRVSDFVTNGTVDQTDDFAGYLFAFDPSGQLSATNGIESVSGNWNLNDDSGVQQLLIDFPSPEALEDLNENWDVTELSDSSVQLQHISGSGPNNPNYLTFERE